MTSDICLCEKCNCSIKGKCNDYHCKCCILNCFHSELPKLIPNLKNVTDEQLERIIEEDEYDQDGYTW